jgi:hypothetical protein
MGQEVKQIVNQNYASGEQVIDINLDGVKPGVYFVNININGVSQSRKLTVN